MGVQREAPRTDRESFNNISVSLLPRSELLCLVTAALSGVRWRAASHCVGLSGAGVFKCKRDKLHVGVASASHLLNCSEAQTSGKAPLLSNIIIIIVFFPGDDTWSRLRSR